MASPAGRGSSPFGDMRRPLLPGRSSSKSSVSSSSGRPPRVSHWLKVTDSMRSRLDRSISKHSLLRRPPPYTRAWLRDLLDGKPRTPFSGVYQRLLTAVALLSVASFVARSSPSVAGAHGEALTALDAATAGLALVDYCFRVAAAPETRHARALPPWRGRAQYVFSLYGLLDALAVFPAMLALREGSLECPVWVRIVRLLTLLRTRRQTQVMSTVARVLHANRRILSVSACVCALLLLWTSAVLWVVASSSPDHAEEFPSVLGALFMSLLMLTGVGMPEGNLPPAMKAMVAVTALLSVAFFAIPAAMLTWGFEGEAERLARQELRRERLLRLGASDQANDLTVSHVASRLGHKQPPREGSRHAHGLPEDSSSEGNSAMEYLQGLGGGEDPEDLMDEALSFFEACDPHDGAPLLPRAQEQAHELQHRAEVQTLRHDLRETAYALLVKLPERLARTQRGGVAAMTTDLHEEVRLRRFAQTARAHLRPGGGAAGGAGSEGAAGRDAEGGAPPGPPTSTMVQPFAVVGAGAPPGPPTSTMVLPRGGASQAAASAAPAGCGQDELLQALVSEVARLRGLVEERLPPPPV